MFAMIICKVKMQIISFPCAFCKVKVEISSCNYVICCKLKNGISEFGMLLAM